jgi:hypothetical protein
MLLKQRWRSLSWRRSGGGHTMGPSCLVSLGWGIRPIDDAGQVLPEFIAGRDPTVRWIRSRDWQPAHAALRAAETVCCTLLYAALRAANQYYVFTWINNVLHIVPDYCTAVDAANDSAADDAAPMLAAQVPALRSSYYTLC